jgi:LmbE family N-acetylglucosaminyl deacetylase
MKLTLDTAKVFVPDGLPEDKALARTTHMVVGTHPDDIEVMAFHGIAECFQRPDKWLAGVCVTDGSGSARDGVYRDYTDDEMRAVRITEQQKAAVVGEYGAQVLLDYPSSAVKEPGNPGPVNDLVEVLKAARPEVLYTHNLADKHETHVAVLLRTIEAIRRLDKNTRPTTVLGCEVWRDLDWLPDEAKVALDCSGHENLQEALLGLFDSQIAGGKRYDLATMGRRRAHATYYASHDTDVWTGVTYAMDLTPLVTDTGIDPAEYAKGFIDRFSEQVVSSIKRLLGQG